MELFVKTLSGDIFIVTVRSSTTIPELKTEIYRKRNLTPSSQRLLFKGKQLTDNSKISDYKLELGSTIYLFISEDTSPHLLSLKYYNTKTKQSKTALLQHGATVDDLKKFISIEDRIPIAEMKLLVAGKQLDPSMTLDDNILIFLYY